MENLANVLDCDSNIKKELCRARIKAVRGPWLAGKVPASVSGRLGPLVFRRAKDYWVVDGPVPLVMARELYADPVGKTDIRVGGHCGCPPPDPEGNFVKWQASDGRRVLSKKDEAEIRLVLNVCDVESPLDEYIFADDPTSVGAVQIVETYHIDTEVGSGSSPTLPRGMVWSD